MFFHTENDRESPWPIKGGYEYESYMRGLKKPDVCAWAMGVVVAAVVLVVAFITVYDAQATPSHCSHRVSPAAVVAVVLVGPFLELRRERVFGLGFRALRWCGGVVF